MAARLTDYDRFCERSLRVEYDSLSQKCFGHLSNEDQRKILGWIEKGPPYASSTRDGLRAHVEHEDDKSEIERMSNKWRLQRIAPMRNDLPAEWKATLERWVAELGEPTPSSEMARIRSTSGDRSPVSVAELAAKPVEGIVEYLIAWKPPGQFDGPSADGLAGTLRSLVAAEPNRIAESACKFKAANPVYVEAVLHGLREAIEKGAKFPWPPVLELCQWVVQQPRDIPVREGRRYGDPPGWRWARGAILSLLERGLQPTECEIPFGVRDAVWGALVPLCEDPDPDPHPEPREENDENDARPAIDSIRGGALQRVLDYGDWIQRHLGTVPGSGDSSKGFDPMPEIREVLEKHLNPEIDRSLGIRTLYGIHIGRVFKLDAEWTRKSIVRIFPRNSEYSDLREAAWNGWVTFCSPGPRALDLLGEEYKYAVGKIGDKSNAKPHGTRQEYELADHLMTFYCWGQIGLERDGLLTQFYEKADDELCARAFQKVGQNLWREKGPVADDLLQRLQTLWDQRMDRARNSQSPNVQELSQFGWWFASGKFEDSWAIGQVIAILPISGKIEPQHLVAERLVATCEKLPYPVLECFNTFLIHDREGWTAGRCRDEIASVLKQTIVNTDPKVKKVRNDLLNRMVARGFQLQ